MPFSLANVSRKLSGIQNSHQFKTNAHNLNFNESFFSNVRYSSSNLTNCKFIKAKLIGIDFIYTNLKRCDFSTAYLEDIIFFGVNLKYAKFKNTHFKNVYFINTNLELTADIDLENSEIIRYNRYPETKIDDSLKDILDKIRENDRIYKHGVLHVNKKKSNMWIIQVLLREFSSNELTKSFSKLITNKTKTSNQNFSLITVIENF